MADKVVNEISLILIVILFFVYKYFAGKKTSQVTNDKPSANNEINANDDVEPPNDLPDVLDDDNIEV